jgi:uncharacterized protein (DUF4415 family)/uncharacterized DUF497 family protein
VENIRFEWDEAKNLSNRRKHGVSFEEASQVFRDPLYVSVQDRVEGGELRWQTLGLIEDLLLLTVAHTVREERDDGKSVEVMLVWWRGSAPPRRDGAEPRHHTTLGERGDAMKSKMVSYTLDKLPPLTKARRANLKALATRPDNEIDTSDIPEMTEEQWKNARRGHFYRPRKRQITARVDADVLDWLKAQGKGYQSRINAILRREMLTSVKSGR